MAQHANPAVTASSRTWELAPADTDGVDALSRQADLPQWVARLLWLRGLRNAQDVPTYLEPSLTHLHDPSLLLGMQSAVRRIVTAVRREEPMLIYGDYDVDGTLATVLLKTAIDRITPRGRPSLVRYHIPHRIREGYGVQPSVLAEAADEGVRLVISVDTGIRAFVAAEEAAARGMDLIVTDHHLPESRGVPQAVAVINPNQTGCAYPETHLCGAAVAWKLAEALLRAAGEPGTPLEPVEPASFEKLQRSLLKLVAIATVADAVPLTGENRAIVALGLAELRDVRQPGLRALMRLAQVGSSGRAPLASEIAFRIAPRINAAGRMDVASDVVALLLTRDPQEAETLAQRLHTLNEDRRNVESSILLGLHEQIDQLIEAAGSERPGIFVLDGEGWHRGVIGILASRVVDRTQRAALVITHDDGAAHGSGRSVEGFHLLDALTSVHSRHLADEGESLFLRFGGHAHAVGFSLDSSLVPALRQRMLAHAAQHGSSQPRAAVSRADALLPLHEVGPETWGWLSRLQPFGNANEEPVFLATHVLLQDVRVLKDRHLKLRVQTGQGSALDCLCWARTFSWPERLQQLDIAIGSPIDLLYQLRWNDRPDYGGLEIHVCDLRRASDAGDL
ncbi:single-stranded-DNA-specific exonuclease RecJ [Terriglobus aquaticus]|uniref:Single-stranded-DNA-specific exonuclease RecJ n=1 Tax=Terriglobus aquaticus TaxID=940139 RepID=A0ABW9KNB3_9BACT|nr:single-stranded-DNA-specific exonuclease RecJ [Terriglobus aquaticus]